MQAWQKRFPAGEKRGKAEPTAQRANADLEREADCIERVLATLSLPVHVRGGQVQDDRVRYHLSPRAFEPGVEVEAALQAVAAALGSPCVRLARVGAGLALEVAERPAESLTLLPLLDLLGDLPPFHLPLGMADGRIPLILDMARRTSWHLLVTGEAECGKSELLRTVAVALALNSPPSEVQMLGIDPGGRELMFLEALPHRLSDLAVEPRFAAELLGWLAAEIGRRRLMGATQPHLFLFVDDLLWLAARRTDSIQERLRLLIDWGPDAGVHLIAGAGRAIGAGSLELGEGQCLVRARASTTMGNRPGAFIFSHGLKRVHAQVAWLPARDLQGAARLIDAVWHGSMVAE